MGRVLRIRKRAITALVIAMLAPALCGCGIFDLKTPEQPFSGTVTEDPLNIGDILGAVRESAADMDYADYFTSNVRFEYTAFRSVDGRSEVIQMLNRLRPRASLVEWQVERGEKRLADHGHIIENVPYIVYSGGREICAGRADFHIIREPDWRISYWKDMPDGGKAPFFEP
jgi:hypothetical protein